jgi:hypothetical protein
MDDLGEVRLWDAAQERYVPAATGRGLRMDVEKARGVVRELESLADNVADLNQGLRLWHVAPPGSDPVSRNIAVQSDRMLAAGRDYLASWHNDLHSAIIALNQQIDSYEDVDRGNTARA